MVAKTKYLGVWIRNDFNDIDELQSKRGSFFSSVNNLRAHFKGLPREILNKLFSHFCTSFYGCQTWNLRHERMKYITTAYNRGLRSVWKLPYNSHTNIVLCVSQCRPISMQIEKRFIKMLICMCNSQNTLVSFIYQRGMCDLSCFVGNNVGYIMCKICF